MGAKKEQDRKQQLDAYRNSGLKQKEWCEATGTNLHNLRYWLGKEKNVSANILKTTESAVWIPLTIESEPAFPSIQINNDIIQLKIGEITLSVSVGFNSSHLLQVLRTVKAL